MDAPQPDSKTGNGREQSVSILSGELSLEGILVLTKKEKQPGLVLCHPHPLYGGSMDDSRILAISKAAAAKGLNTLRFNFRGVGKSQGQFGQGIGEMQDTIAAMEFLCNQSHIDNSRIALLGYSFGGSIALAAAMDANPAALVTISAPIRSSEIDSTIVTEGIRYVNCPVYIVHGRDDDSVHHVEAEGIYAQLQVKEKYLRLIKGANHFWTRRLNFIIPMIIAFLTDKLGMK
ncbi:MAG: alpha/beta fold hydrolase [Candidatus Hermodarchaeota archaeon]|nr:alpha/beta fold hydrolase [Candidatus Hermodarchaeota archaeon]